MFRLRLALTEKESFTVLHGCPEIFATGSGVLIQSPAGFRIANWNGIGIGRMQSIFDGIFEADLQPTGKYWLRRTDTPGSSGTAWYYSHGSKKNAMLTCNTVMPGVGPVVFNTLELAKEACKTLGSRTYKPEEILA